MSRERFFSDMPNTYFTPAEAKRRLVNRLQLPEAIICIETLIDPNMPHMYKALVEIAMSPEGYKYEYFTYVAKYREFG